MKEIFLKSYEQDETIDVLKELSFLRTFKKENEFLDFYGCVYNKQERIVYLIMEMMKKNLGHSEIVDFYQKPDKFRFEKYVDLFEIIKKLNENHLIHLDIKPENIMINGNFSDDFYSLKLIDYGLGEEEGEIKSAGTPQYSHPQIINGFPTVFNTFDVFSMALVVAKLEVQRLYPRTKIFARKSCYGDKRFKKSCLGEVKNNIWRGMMPIEEGIKKRSIPYDKNKIINLIDCKKLTCILLNCLNFNPHDIPSANQVIKAIEKIINLL